MQPKNKPANCSFQSTTQHHQTKCYTLNVLQWNAGGLTQDKKTELYNTVSNHKIDVFFVMEANITSENLQKYELKGYALHNLPKYRQVASGILVGINNSLCAQFQIVKEMGNSKIESRNSYNRNFEK